MEACDLLPAKVNLRMHNTQIEAFSSTKWIYQAK